jgi:hypothetical protein
MLIISYLAFLSGVEAGPQEDSLIHRIFKEQPYYVSSRPVEVEANSIEVKFGLSLQQIVDVVRSYISVNTKTSL